MRWMVAIATAAALCVTMTAVAQNGSRSGALTIIEAGYAPDGTTPRYTVDANGADLRDLLAALLRKTGKEFVINQDVAGPISLTLKDKTLDDILAFVCKVARPPIVIKQGDIITVSLAPISEPTGEPQPVAESPRQSPTGRVAAVRTNQQQIPAVQSPLLSQPVTLSIPEDRPVALRVVLQQIANQTRVPIWLDPRVSGDVGVSARFTDTPLSLVLDSMARTGALKWHLRQDGAVVISPSDWMLISLRGVPVWGSPSSATCSSCGRQVLPSWRFCPYDGTPVGQRNQNRQGAVRNR